MSVAENARREQPGPEGTGRILTDGWQLSQGGSGRRGHTPKLPADLLADSGRSRAASPAALAAYAAAPRACAPM